MASTFTEPNCRFNNFLLLRIHLSRPFIHTPPNLFILFPTRTVVGEPSTMSYKPKIPARKASRTLRLKCEIPCSDLALDYLYLPPNRINEIRDEAETRMNTAQKRADFERYAEAKRELACINKWRTECGSEIREAAIKQAELRKRHEKELEKTKKWEKEKGVVWRGK